MDLKDLLQKSPLEMTDEELRESVQKIQNVRRIPNLSAAIHGKRKTKTKTTTTKEPELTLEEALIKMAAAKEAKIDNKDGTKISTKNG